MADSYNNSILLIDIIYGLSFFAFGVIALLTPAKNSSLSFAKNLIWLAAFGILQGVLTFADIVHQLAPNLLSNEIRFIFLASSFLALFEFGRRSLTEQPFIRRFSTVILYSVVFALVIGISLLADSFALGFKAAVHYIVAFPGSIMTGIAFFQPRKYNNGNWLVSLSYRSLALAFLVYAPLVLFLNQHDPQLSELLVLKSFQLITDPTIKLMKVFCASVFAFSLSYLTFSALTSANEKLLHFTTSLNGFILQICKGEELVVQSASSGLHINFGIELEKILNKPISHFLGLIHQDDREMVLKELEHSMSSREGLNIGYRFKSDQGEYIWVSHRGQVSTDSYGKNVIESIVIEDSYHQLAEQAMKKNKSILDRAESIAKIGSWELDLTTNTLLWTDEIYRIFEIDKERFGASYEAFLEAIHPEDRDKVNQAYQNSLQDRKPYQIDHRLKMKDGRIKFVSEMCETIFDTNGTPLVSNGTVQDITERYREQSTIKRLASIVKHAHDFIGISDMEGNVYFINDYGKKLIGIDSDQDLKNTKIADYFPVEEEQRINQEIIPQLLNDGRWLGEINFQHLKTKEKILMMYNAFQVTDPDTGEAIALATITQDIRERKRAEQSLQDSEARYQRAERGTNDGLWEWNTINNHLFLSKRWLDILGYSEGELDEHLDTFYSLIHPEDKNKVARAVEAHLHYDKHYDIEFRMQHKNSSYIWIRSRGEAERNSKGETTLMTGAISDISIRKKQEVELVKYKNSLEDLVEERTKELIQARDDAQKANIEKSKFLSRMSHELRTPLNAILGFSQLIKTDPNDPISELQADNINEVIVASRHLLSLVNEVLDLARIESGKLKLVKQQVALISLLEESITQLEPLAKQKDINITLNVNSLSPNNDIIESDPTRLKQILVNLISNAIKYNHEKGNVMVLVNYNENEYLKIEVEDSGLGIPEEFHGKIFLPFERCESQYDSIEGTGIGLALTKEIVESMGGTIGVSSQLGIGSRFWINIPLVA